jgi:guanylate kinase
MMGISMVDPFLLMVLSSPSGAGKTTLTRRLRESFPALRFSVSHTTRKPRSNEIDGKDYHFVDRAQFDALVGADAFVEWAEVHGNCYGTSRLEIDRARQDPECAGMIFDIDYQGARQIRAKQPDVVTIFILPPSMDELLKRLRGRASETEEVVKKRVQAAQIEIEHYGFFDYLVVNDDLETAFKHLEGIVLAERSRRFRRADLAERSRRSRRAELAERLLRAGKL